MKSSNHSTKIEYQKSNESPFLRLLSYLGPYKKQILVIALAVIIVNLSALIKPYFIKVVIDYFVEPKTDRVNGFTIPMIALIYVVAMAVGMGFFYLQVNLITKVGQSIMSTLRDKLFTTIQNFSLSYLDKTTAGRLITRATNDVEAISELFTDILVNMVKDTILIIGIIIAMIRIDIKLTGFGLIIIPFMITLVYFVKRALHKNWIVLKTITSKMNGKIAENISGMKIVQLFNGQKEKFQEFDELNKSYFKKSVFQIRMHSFMGPSANVFESIAIALILYFGMKYLNNGEVLIGDITAMTFYIRQFFAPVADIAESFTSIESALVSAQRVFEIIDSTDSTEDIYEGVALKDVKGKIEFKNVWFSYDGENYVLKDVSFTINPGESIAIIGETGSGKTTIISLLSGFYKIQKGEILIDGINIDDIKKKDLRRNIAVVLQDVFLFSGNIRDNITLNDTISDEDINRAVDASYSRIMIDNFEKGIYEPVMERGATFSMGQRQLLSFARALAHDPAIFVLDEATANIDTKTEVLIQKAIEKASEDRTTIIIAHRLSTIRNVDNILVLDHGVIIESGNHEELMAKDSRYKQMIEKGSKIAS